MAESISVATVADDERDRCAALAKDAKVREIRSQQEVQELQSQLARAHKLLDRHDSLAGSDKRVAAVRQLREQGGQSRSSKIHGFLCEGPSGPILEPLPSSSRPFPLLPGQEKLCLALLVA